MAASAAFALKPGVWLRRGRLLIVSPDSLGTACPLSGRNSTYRPVQISETSSMIYARTDAGKEALNELCAGRIVEWQEWNPGWRTGSDKPYSRARIDPGRVDT